jgi:hypothetical protein
VAKEIAAAAVTRAEDLERQATAAKEARDQAAARVKEIEDALKSLGAPDAKDEDAAPPEDEGDDSSPADDPPSA